MALNAAYLNATADAGGALIKFLALIDDTGAEISGGTYARQAVAWTAGANGVIRPTADKTFNIPAGKAVAGWRGYSAATGGINYDGEALPVQPYTTAGTYILKADQTSITHTATPAA